RHVAVWGTGREGRAAVAAIAAHGPAGLVAVDDSDGPASLPWEGELAQAAPRVTGAAGFDRLAAADVVVRSPGVPQTHPWVVELRRRGAVITSGTALWMAEHARRTVGVTGSKGKSTTSSLISHLLTAVGRANVFGGNIGVPVLDLPQADLYVLELSSYQCSDLTDSPRVAVVTALFPDHVDAHGGEREYYRDKLNILAHGPEAIVINATDARLVAEVGDRPVVRAAVPEGFHVADGWFRLRDVPLFPRSALSLVGRHNEGNLCVALAALDALGVDCVAERDTLAAAVAAFGGLPHRLTEIVDPSGLIFVDDGLATNPHAAGHAIDAYRERPLTVIVGGADRGVDYRPLRDHLVDREATVIGIPDNGPRILDVLRDLPGVRTESADDLVEAVRLARRITPDGGVVLLSPAAPSYGRFRNFEHRSEVFRQAIRDTADR
ncbi:MAG TPA: UDP-N-acetylmuramoyl-L-alanine--D-glutamate ligase, partial [Micromonosporaceae bacterium]